MCAGGIQEPGPVGFQHRYLSFAQHMDAAGVVQEGRDRRGDEVLTLAHADHERALPPGSDEQVRMIGAHRDEGKMAGEVLQGCLHRGHEIALIVVRDEVSDHLGVGLGAELRAGAAQLVAKGEVVLDDPVENDGHAAVGV